MTFRCFARAFVVVLFGPLLVIPVLSSPAHANDGQYIRGGFHYFTGTWTSHNAVYQLKLQGDGNLVLYFRQLGQEFPVWATNTQGAAPRLTVKSSGLIELFGKDRFGVEGRTWSSGRSFPGGVGPSFLKVQNDGKLVMYRGIPDGPATAFFWNGHWNPQSRPNPGFVSV